jgi:hypothetical protein
MGRPSSFTADILQEICDRLSEGEPLACICRDEDMPAARTVRSWMEGDTECVPAEEVSAAIARARIIGHDAIAARTRQTARGKTADEGGDSTGDVQRDKLIIETDLKLLAKWDPKRYGDLIKLSGADGQGPVPVVALTADMTAAQAAEAYAKLIG